MKIIKTHEPNIFWEFRMKYRLKELSLNVVENQLRDNDPKAMKETFDRLVSKGYDKIKAKEMIASVVVEEIYYILKNGQVFDEKIFAEKLGKLK